MSLLSEMRALVAEIDDASNEAFNLWTWLPSYYFATKAHGDYAGDVSGDTPPDIMREACAVLSYLAGYPISPFNEEMFGCKCGECDVPTVAEVEEYINSKMQGNE